MQDTKTRESGGIGPAKTRKQHELTIMQSPIGTLHLGDINSAQLDVLEVSVRKNSS